MRYLNKVLASDSTESPPPRRSTSHRGEHIPKASSIGARLDFYPIFADKHYVFFLRQADTQEMPNVDDYIAQKAAVYELQQHMANWERKVTR